MIVSKMDQRLRKMRNHLMKQSKAFLGQILDHIVFYKYYHSNSYYSKIFIQAQKMQKDKDIRSQIR